jgi:uncharacterized phiE125 gp8 family phage protein
MSVTLDELKSHLKIDGDSDDSSLQIYLDAAIAYVETHTGHKLSRESRNSYFDTFYGLELVGESPVSVVINYIDTDGNSQVLAGTVYSLKTHKIRPYLALDYGQSAPSHRTQDAAIHIEYTSGYTATTLPASLKSAVLLVAGDLNEFKEAKTVMQTYENTAVSRLINPYRIFTL